MKNWFFIVIALFTARSAAAQSPVSWHFRAQTTGDHVYEIHITATIANGWHIYAQQQPKNSLSQPTKIVFAKNPLIKLNGEVKETGKKTIQKMKEIGVEQYCYAGEVDFVQSVQLRSPAKMNLTGTITYQVCTDAECLPPQTIPFSLPLP